ncbi:MAG: hypothetical protein IPM56_07840 [Ignavibacteriales bacterium]|nr:MAG: hypothetical protein IPM56_07840 [Ignavibacteriales bacterium]
MAIKRFILRFIQVFALTFFVNAVIVYVYSIIVHGEGSFAFDTTILFSLTFGLVFAIMELLNRK